MESSRDRRRDERRALAERRSGKDTRPIEEREILGERRVNSDRRALLDRRSDRDQPQRRPIFLKIVVATGALLLADVHFFGGMHSIYVLEMIGRDINSQVMEWLSPVFSRI